VRRRGQGEVFVDAAALFFMQPTAPPNKPFDFKSQDHAFGHPSEKFLKANAVVFSTRFKEAA
jgi:hypothetical protein